MGGRADVTVFDEIDSTNEEAKRRIREGLSKPALYLAEAQTNGRGRVGHTFYSPKYTGLYFSLAYPVPQADASILRVTAKAAVAVVRGIQARLNLALSIKWVNDIYVGSRKVAGILTEHVTDPEGNDFVIVGIGVNVTTAEFPDEIKDRAGSLDPGLPGFGKTDVFSPDRNDIAGCIAEVLLYELDHMEETEYLDAYRAHSNVLGRQVTFSQYNDGRTEEKTGTAITIDDSGALIVLDKEGRRERLDSGEIRVRTWKGDL
ncbi:MAG: biotin--[Lachnospiraceae bacterium]|nr:biotin--[acetyl-CoA-carboxylase] ligase [Lachnospiraceae bacterium]